MAERILRAFSLPGLVLGLSLSAGAQPGGEGLVGYVPADPDAPVVREANLVASERFWPYQVEIVRERRGQDGGSGAPLFSGTRGVLLRVDEEGRARVDFGRHGVHEVPVEATDLVERANRVREGEERKIAPNLTHVIGPRTMDASAEEPRSFDFDRSAEVPGYLTVFADPHVEGFEALARKLAPLESWNGVRTVLFPQGRIPDPEMWERLEELEWGALYVLDHLADAYTSSQLGEGVPLPAVMLQTAEGRVLYRSSWGDEVTKELEAALEEHFGGGSSTADVVGRLDSAESIHHPAP